MDADQKWPMYHEERLQTPEQPADHTASSARIQKHSATGKSDITEGVEEQRTTTWRLIRRALATAERAARYSTNIDNHCADCGAVENDAHLSFHCNLPRAVWFSLHPPLRTDHLPHEEDGVQLILQTIISNSTTNLVFNKILITLWYLWKARNDNRFHRRNWNPWQVHHAVAAHIATYSPGTASSSDSTD